MSEVKRQAEADRNRRHAGRRSAVVKELRIAKSTVLKRITQWGLQDEGRGAGDPAPEDDDGEG